MAPIATQHLLLSPASYLPLKRLNHQPISFPVALLWLLCAIVAASSFVDFTYGIARLLIRIVRWYNSSTSPHTFTNLCASHFASHHALLCLECGDQSTPAPPTVVDLASTPHNEVCTDGAPNNSGDLGAEASAYLAPVAVDLGTDLETLAADFGEGEELEKMGGSGNEEGDEKEEDWELGSGIADYLDSLHAPQSEAYWPSWYLDGKATCWSFRTTMPTIHENRGLVDFSPRIFLGPLHKARNPPQPPTIKQLPDFILESASESSSEDEESDDESIPTPPAIAEPVIAFEPKAVIIPLMGHFKSASGDDWADSDDEDFGAKLS